MGPAASAIPVQGHPPGTSPRIPLLENWQQVMLGCAADLRYQRGGRGMGGESGTEEAAKGGGESKRVHITLPGQGRCRGQEMVRKVPAEPMSMLPSQGPCCWDFWPRRKLATRGGLMPWFLHGRDAGANTLWARLSTDSRRPNTWHCLQARSPRWVGSAWAGGGGGMPVIASQTAA